MIKYRKCMPKTGILYKLSGGITGVLAIDNTLSSINNFMEFNKYSRLSEYLIRDLVNYNPFGDGLLSYSTRMVPDEIMERLYSLASVAIRLNELFTESLFKNSITNAASAIGLGLASAFLIKRGMEIDSEKNALENKISTYEIKNLYTFKE